MKSVYQKAHNACVYSAMVT